MEQDVARLTTDNQSLTQDKVQLTQDNTTLTSDLQDDNRCQTGS